MNLTGPIHIQVVSDRPADLGGLIVQLKVSAGRKNPYYILSPKTDEGGATIIGVEDFRGQFEDHYEQGLMDYDGSIATADSTVGVSLFDPTWSLNNPKLALAWPLLKNEVGKWSSREEEYRHRTTCRNLLYGFTPITVDLHVTTNVRVSVWPR